MSGTFKIGGAVAALVLTLAACAGPAPSPTPKASAAPTPAATSATTPAATSATTPGASTRVGTLSGDLTMWQTYGSGAPGVTRGEPAAKYVYSSSAVSSKLPFASETARNE